MLLLVAALLRGDWRADGGLRSRLAGFGFSVYLTYLELFVIDAICQWCVASAVLMTVLFGFNAARMLVYVGKTTMSGKKAREKRREERLQHEDQEAIGQERRQRLIKLGSAVAFLVIAAVAVLDRDQPEPERRRRRDQRPRYRPGQ